MPTVPRYAPVNPAGQSVTPSAAPAVRFTPDENVEAFGGGGKDVQAGQKAVADATVTFVNQEHDKADQVAVLDAVGKLSKQETDLQYGPDGALTKKGKDAFGVYESTMEKWKKGTADIRGSLANDKQRLAFDKTEMSQRNSLGANLQRYTVEQGQQYDAETTNAYLTNERDAATTDYLNHNRIADSVSRQEAALMDFGRRNGKSQAWVDEKVADSVSKTHASVITRMLANDQDLTASAYFKNFKDKIVGSDIASVEKSLEEGTLRGDSQRKADAIMQTATTRKDGLDAARGITDPKVRDAVETRINQRFSEIEQAKTEQRNDLYLKATNILDNSPRNTDPRKVIAPDMWTQLSMEQRNALQARAEDPVNDDHLWLQFLDIPAQKLADMSRADFESKYWANFDKSHRSRAEAQWNAAQEASIKSALDPKLSSTLTFNERVNDTVKNAGLIPADKEKAKYSKDQATLYAQFEQAAASQVEHFELTQLGGKRKATGDEIQKILDDMVVKRVFVDKSWWPDTEKPVAILTEGEKGASYVPLKNIPTPELNSIKNVIKARGRQVSTNKLQRAYAAFLMKNRRAFDSIVAE